MPSILRAAVGAVGVVVLAGELSAAPLTCKIGAWSTTNKSCSTTTQLTPEYEGPCDDTNSSCFTANYRGDWYAAYGCYPDEDMDFVKGVWKFLCSSDALCSRNNPGGTPTDGYTICKSDECNFCNGASRSAAGAAVGAVVLAVAVTSQRD